MQFLQGKAFFPKLEFLLPFQSFRILAELYRSQAVDYQLGNFDIDQVTCRDIMKGNVKSQHSQVLRGEVIIISA